MVAGYKSGEIKQEIKKGNIKRLRRPQSPHIKIVDVEKVERNLKNVKRQHTDENNDSSKQPAITENKTEKPKRVNSSDVTNKR